MLLKMFSWSAPVGFLESAKVTGSILLGTGLVIAYVWTDLFLEPPLEGHHFMRISDVCYKHISLLFIVVF